MSKTIIVSNRLPVKISRNEAGELRVQSSEGGLATGLNSLQKKGGSLWVGWPGTEIQDDKKAEVTQLLADSKLAPLFLSQDEINNFYEGFSNSTLWPVFHYMPSRAEFEKRYFDAYIDVNKKFAREVVKQYEDGDTIWIHDYQLLLLPAMLREALPDATIGFFQHIPFPSWETFRLIPQRKALVSGILGADLIGYHTYDDVTHFINSAGHQGLARSSANVITADERTLVVESFPMGIDHERFEAALEQEDVKANILNLKSNFNKVKLILTIDRLDYSKGILQRLLAYDNFLKENRDYIEKVTLYMIIVPSRDSVAQYATLRNDIDQLVGNINARYRTIDWHPIQYFYRPFNFEMLVALYHIADVCLVTPMRDGMNLVCKEYVACRTNDDGVLILSEMAGASKELVDALIVNPNDIQLISDTMREALEMPKEEQRRRMKQMRQLIAKFNIKQWVKIFMDRLGEVKELQESLKAKYIGSHTETRIKSQFFEASKRALFLDYDGTLVGFQADIDKAEPDADLYDILRQLTSDTANKLVVISGRNHQALQKWFGHLPIDLIAEHGAWKKCSRGKWETIPGLSADWKKDIYPLLQLYADRTPGTFIEEKDYSLVWHYRKADEGLADLRASDLSTNLKYMAVDRGLQILPGNKVIEIKNVEINKGRAVSQWLQKAPYEFIMAIGDDHTDEDIFKALPEEAVTVKVGSNISAARYYLHRHLDVRRFLRSLILH